MTTKRDDNDPGALVEALAKAEGMIIEMNDDDEEAEFEEEFDTNDLATETPERIAKAFARLVEMYADLERTMDKRIKRLDDDAGLTFTIPDNDLVVADRARAVAGHARLLADFDDEAA